MNSAPRDSTIPFLVAAAGIATYAAMDVLMKGLSIELGAYNAMLWRTMVATLLSGLFFFWRRSPWPQRSTLRLHLWRGLVTAIMAFLFFWGLVHVPIAEAIALSFIAPLIALYLALVILDEKIGGMAVIASLVGFSGAIVIVAGKLGGEYSDKVWMGIGAILCSAVLYAYNLILQRQQAIIAKPFEIAFFQNSTVVSLYLLFAPFLAVAPPSTQLPQLLSAAVLGFMSLLFLSWAYARAEARILIPVEYTAFIWAAILGWMVFDETVTLTTLVGTVLIVIGCLMATRQQ
jgi:S-adenosylmethionine uptake transporter